MLWVHKKIHNFPILAAPTSFSFSSCSLLVALNGPGVSLCRDLSRDWWRCVSISTYFAQRRWWRRRLVAILYFNLVCFELVNGPLLHMLLGFRWSANCVEVGATNATNCRAGFRRCHLFRLDFTLSASTGSNSDAKTLLLIARQWHNCSRFPS